MAARLGSNSSCNLLSTAQYVGEASETKGEDYNTREQRGAQFGLG